MERKRLGLALCGSYCTYETLFAAAEPLAQRYEPDTAERMAMAVMSAAGETLTGREPGKEIPDLTDTADPGNTRPMQRAREFARDVSHPE